MPVRWLRSFSLCPRPVSLKRLPTGKSLRYSSRRSLCRTETPSIPVSSGNSLAFTTLSQASLNSAAIYQLQGGSLTKIADTRNFAPGEYRRFDHFDEALAVNGDQIAFTGSTIPFGSAHLYLAEAGSLRVVADADTALPGSGVLFVSGYLNVRANNFNRTHLVLNAYGRNADGTYTSGLYSRENDGTLIRLADNSMTGPGLEVPFHSFVSPQLSGDRVAFLNNTNGAGRGAYLYEGGAIHTLANTTTPVPGTRHHLQPHHRSGHQ